MLTAAIGALKIAAVVIFVLAGAVAGAVAALVAKTMGDTPTGKIVGTVVPVLVIAIATFTILDQLKIAPAIVTITYAALLGSAALGLALALGLGGRDVAKRMLEDAYDKGQEKKEDAKGDLDKGKERAQDQAQQARSQAQGGGSPQPGGSSA